MDNKLKVLKEIRYHAKHTNYIAIIVMYSVFISLAISIINLIMEVISCI